MRHNKSLVTLILGVLSVFAALNLQAQSNSKISTILNPDGSVKGAAVGSFDPTGYRMSYGPGGEPRFIDESHPLGGCTPDSWDTSFTTNGVDDEVNVIVTDGAGNVYIGGEFNNVQGLPIAGIAKWNGATWSGLGTGTTGVVNTIAISGTDIYIGGDFAGVGGILAKNVAKWNGSAWSALGAGLGGGTHVVKSVAIYNNEVYFGGNFNTGDGSPASGIARWNGSSWSAVGTGGPTSNDLVVKDNLLYSATVASGLMFWDGTNWSSVAGVTGSITKVLVSGSDIWVLGNSMTVNGNSSALAKWNGTAWSAFGTFNTAAVYSLAVVGTDIYVGGSFTRSGGQNTSDGVLKYNGTAWVGVGTGTQGGGHSVQAMLPLGNKIYTGGDFLTAGGIGAKNIAAIVDGSTWEAFSGSGIDNAAAAVAVSGSDVYVGGAFISAGSVTANRIAKWNSLTNTWSAMGGGITGTGTDFSAVNAIAVAGGKVYAGGSFPRIGGVTAANIAVWNGTVWAPLGTGITGGNARVYQIFVKGDDVWVAGDFTTAGGAATNRIAKWNGTSWTAFPTAPIPNSVTGLTFIGNDMYVSSDTNTSENPNYLLKFDGTTWTGIAPGMGGAGIRSIVAIGTDLYAAGAFTAIGGVPANRVAKWNGTSWSALGGGLPSDGTFANTVFLGKSGSDLIASGNFTVATGGPGNRAARWNGSTWQPLGNGLNNTYATQIVSGGGSIYVGGGFSTAGCNQSSYFSRWRENAWTAATNTDWHTNTNWGAGSPPPPTGSATIASGDASITSADVTIESLAVTSNRTLTIGAGRTLTVTGTLYVSGGTIAGPGTLVVNDLSMANGASVTSSGPITVNGNLYLDGGFINGGPVSVTACRPGAISGGSATSFISSAVTRCVAPGGTYVFTVGTGSVYAPVELANVSGTGSFTVEPKSGPHPGATGLPTNRLQRWWSTTNGGIASADLTFSYVDSELVGLESWYRVYGINGGSAVQLSTTINTATNRQTVNGISTFGAWTLGEGTSSLRILTGRLSNPNGRGASGVLVSLTDDQNNVRYTMTNPFGYYRFQDVPTFRSYTVRVISKKFTFSPLQRVVDFDELTTSVNFVSSDN